MIVLIFFTNMTIIAVPLVITTDQRESPGEAITTPGTTRWREAPTPGLVFVGFQNTRGPRAASGRKVASRPCAGGRLLREAGRGRRWLRFAGRKAFKRASFTRPATARSAGPRLT